MRISQHVIGAQILPVGLAAADLAREFGHHAIAAECSKRRQAADLRRPRLVRRRVRGFA